MKRVLPGNQKEKSNKRQKPIGLEQLDTKKQRNHEDTRGEEEESSKKQMVEARGEGSEWPFQLAFSRWVDGHTCGFRSCAKKIDPRSAAVVLATNMKVWKKVTKAQQQKSLVNWETSQVVLHAHCWDSFCSQEKGVSRKEGVMRESAEETAEFYDNQQDVLKKVEEATDLVLRSKYITSFTGAGASVTSGIGTYRGTEGIDTKEALGQGESDSEESDVDYESLVPTPTHKGLVTLYNNDKMHAVITQNCDNLHGKAGTPREVLYELHGNVFAEYCEDCEKEYFRDYCTDLYSTNCYAEKWFKKCPKCGLGHYTGRLCEDKKCKGKLRDTIINFGDFLNDNVLGGLPRATKECKKADLCFVLGSSLTVPPASLLPFKAKKVVICNLQKTDYDEKATVRIFYPCDDFVTLLLEKLGFVN
eukprot:TRINITY_DN5233_c1_g2_i1.p1 TRINITY_DN5233_c1_g2~~TRINITY_DN5233_c1_g2_i1.p1  ORF type:complete len:426 (+),score=74.04 TRINITY_DN5233_c1_g2_i1:30-1280(+)